MDVRIYVIMYVFGSKLNKSYSEILIPLDENKNILFEKRDRRDWN